MPASPRGRGRARGDGRAAREVSWTVLLFLCLSACRTAPLAFHSGAAFDYDDYVYDAQLSPDGAWLAFSKLGLKSYSLAICLVPGNLGFVADKPCRVDVPINGYEFDVEALAWSPDSDWVATASRDGVVRIFDVHGALKAGWLTDEKLTAVAVAPDGRSLALGGEHGLVTLLSFESGSLRFADEKRLHTDEVRALAFTNDGRLFTAGWDKTAHLLKPQARSVRSGVARVHAERAGGSATVRAIVSGKASAPLALDSRVHATLALRAAAAQGLGIDVNGLTDSVSLPTPLGTTLGRVAHDVTLEFKALTLEHVDAVICDACVPEGANGALGDGFNERVEVAFDEVTHEAVLKLKSAPTADRELLQLDEVSKFELPAYVNDLSLDRAGTKMALALSESKAQRNMEVYQREKRGEPEPEREWDAVVIADAATGQVLQKFHDHRGVVSTAALSPDGNVVVSGGWDHHVVLRNANEVLETFELGALVRRVRISSNGHWFSVAAWTPRKPSDGSPSAFVVPIPGYRRFHIGADD